MDHGLPAPRKPAQPAFLHHGLPSARPQLLLWAQRGQLPALTAGSALALGFAERLVVGLCRGFSDSLAPICLLVVPLWRFGQGSFHPFKWNLFPFISTVTLHSHCRGAKMLHPHDVAEK